MSTDILLHFVDRALGAATTPQEKTSIRELEIIHASQGWFALPFIRVRDDHTLVPIYSLESGLQEFGISEPEFDPEEDSERPWVTYFGKEVFCRAETEESVKRDSLMSLALSEETVGWGKAHWGTGWSPTECVFNSVKSADDAKSSMEGFDFADEAIVAAKALIMLAEWRMGKDVDVVRAL